MRTYHAGQVSKRGPGQDAVEPHSASASSVERVALATSRVRSRGYRYAVATLLALALGGCAVPAQDVGDRIAQFDYPDAGVKCWLYKPSSELAGSLSCVRAEVRP